MSERAPLRVEHGELVEETRDGLLVQVPVFVFDAAPRPDLAALLRRGGSIGFFETPWTVEGRESARAAVLHIRPIRSGMRRFAVMFPLERWAGLLRSAATVGELGLRLNTLASLPPPMSHLTIWIRGQNEMLRALLEAEN